MVATAPDAGQFVRVRGRQFVVADVDASNLPGDELHPLEGPQHLVTLKSIEDDGLGDEIRVVWELEPGARPIPSAGLPSPQAFDLPERLEAFLDAVRWGAIASAEVRRLQAPFRAGIEIEDYQLEPVVKALEMPRVSLLIADDVGLGKTIEAGMVALELILRHRTQSILIVCPASLQRQWQDQMRDKFGLEFQIVDRALLKDLRRRRGIHANPWTDFPRLITSLDYLKRDRQMRAFREVLPAANESRYPRRFDLLIVDEAHNVAPSGSVNYAVDSQKTQAIRTLAPHFEHKLFLTATPHNGFQQSFTALLELLDDQRFARGVPPDPRQLESVMVRRLKDDIVDEHGRRRFPPRIVTSLEVDYTEEERRGHALLSRFSELRRAGIESAGGAQAYAHEFVLKLLKKRLFSSPAALAQTLETHQRSLSERKPGLSAPDSVLLRRVVEETDEAFDDDDLRDEQEDDALGVSSRALPPLTPEQRQVFNELRDWAERASERADSKARTLIDWLHTNIRPNGQWNDNRVIIFTEYRDTQRWLQELLTGEGLAGSDRLLTLYGGMTTDDRERVKAAFQARPEESNVRILLATDAASEGIDLQNHCSRLIHYEIPWNPNRMEQRNGRIDRHGQRADKVEVFHFVGKGFEDGSVDGRNPGSLEGDLEFIARAARKVETIRQDIGKVGPIISQQVEEAMLGRRRSLDTSVAEQEARAIRAQVPRSLRVREDLARLRERLAATREELNLEPDRIAAVVAIALELADQPRLQPVEMPEREPGRPTGPAFVVPTLIRDWSAAMTGLEHPHTGRRRPITFDPEVSRGRDDVVLAHLNHRLVDGSLRLLRAQIWSDAAKQQLNRATARVVANEILNEPAVVVHARLVVTGADGDRLHEEIITAGGYLRDRFARFPRVGEAPRLLEASSNEVPASQVSERLLASWPQYESAVMAAVSARRDDRVDGLRSRLDERRDKEIEAITSVLEELRRSIDRLIGEAENEQSEFRQLELLKFGNDEREQFDRDLDTLKRRRDEIPAEIEQETDAIRRRYERPEAHVFPVALTFLVPAHSAGLAENEQP